MTVEMYACLLLACIVLILAVWLLDSYNALRHTRERLEDAARENLDMSAKNFELECDNGELKYKNEISQAELKSYKKSHEDDRKVIDRQRLLLERFREFKHSVEDQLDRIDNV